MRSPEKVRVGALELTWVLTSAFPLIGCVILGSFLDLFELESIHLQKVDTSRIYPKESVKFE